MAFVRLCLVCHPSFPFEVSPMQIFVSCLQDLQDARYCAAMNADYISFATSPTLPHYLPPAKIREIAAWLSGPEVLMAATAAATTDLEELEKTMPFYGLEVLDSDASYFRKKNKPLFVHGAQLGLRGQADIYIVPVKAMADLQQWEHVTDQVFLHFSDIGLLRQFLQDKPTQGFRGVYIGQEGFSAEGLLEYEVLDGVFALRETV